ncbi:hypothetical protein EUTSA_v10005648mg [Eutrema salsugineum]|uniref:Uncharacterized protein n=1 Tax=Eutrema salsugineum TaxID=72664 RepID=V4KRA9_EUTSA|nr:hypothetical protein EUTSA_v10005648mg [Eutrema salsugineum]
MVFSIGIHSIESDLAFAPINVIPVSDQKRKFHSMEFTDDILRLAFSIFVASEQKLVYWCWLSKSSASRGHSIAERRMGNYLGLAMFDCLMRARTFSQSES